MKREDDVREERKLFEMADDIRVEAIIRAFRRLLAAQELAEEVNMFGMDSFAADIYLSKEIEAVTHA